METPFVASRAACRPSTAGKAWITVLTCCAPHSQHAQSGGAVSLPSLQPLPEAAAGASSTPLQPALQHCTPCTQAEDRAQ